MRLRLAVLSAAAAALLFTASGVGGPRLLPLPSLRADPDWLTVTTGSTDPGLVAPSVWAITASQGTSALVPFDLFNGLRSLSPDGAVIWASTGGRGGETPTFRRATLPLRLGSFRLDRLWEGQPAANVQQRLRWVSVAGCQLDVRVYFGTQQPSRELRAIVQAELNRLMLPR